MTVPTVSLSNIVNLFVSLVIAGGLLYYGHQGLERELARENRSLWVEGFYAAVVVCGLLVAPTLRDRIVPAAKVGFKVFAAGRRAYDGKVTAETPKDGPV